MSNYINSKFSFISHILPDVPKTWEDKIFISFDLDWCHDDIILDTLDLISKSKKKSARGLIYVIEGKTSHNEEIILTVANSTSRAILERMVGILVTLIYTGFTAMKSIENVFTGPIGSMAKFFCFGDKTYITLISGLKKKLVKLKLVIK